MSGAISRKLNTAYRTLHDGGVGGLSLLVRERISLAWALFSKRSVDSVTLNGCTFDLTDVPNSSMKLALLKGDYEGFERRAVLKYMEPDTAVIELGGCIGVIACISNRLLNDRQAHIVVEANPFAIPLLEENRKQNEGQFEIVHSAIAYGREAVTFSPERDLWGNSLNRLEEGTTVTVPTTSLGDLVRSRNLDSFTLICDIEGHEYELVESEISVVAKAGMIILETHPSFIGQEKTEHMMQKLSDVGFREIDRDGFVVVLKRTFTV